MEDAIRIKGIILAIIESIFWGMSGTVAEYLFEHHLVTPIWLVGIRLFVAGLLLLCWSRITTGESIFKIWHNKREILTLIAFALLGMLPFQLTYFMEIRYGNVPTASVLQFFGPILLWDTLPFLIISYLTLLK